MSDSYAQEPAEVYGDQLHIDSRIDYNFVPIPKRLVAVWPIIGNDAVLLYCLLTNYVNFGRGDRTAWPTQELLRNITGFGRNRMMRTIKTLRDYGMIETAQMRKGKEFGANRYVLTRVNEWKIPNTDVGVPEFGTPTVGTPTAGTQIRSNVLNKNNSLIRSNAHKNASACEKDFFDAADVEQEVGLGMGYKDEDRLATGENRTIPPNHACAQFHPGFPCPHEKFALGEIARIMWNKKPVVTGSAGLKSHHSLHAYIHKHAELVGPPDDWEIVAINHVRQLCEWWKANRKPKDWSIPLMFSRPEETLATAQSVQAPGGATGLARYVEKLRGASE